MFVLPQADNEQNVFSKIHRTKMIVTVYLNIELIILIHTCFIYISQAYTILRVSRTPYTENNDFKTNNEIYQIIKPINLSSN